MLQKASTELLVDSYEKAVALKLNKDFIQLLNEELSRRTSCSRLKAFSQNANREEGS